MMPAIVSVLQAFIRRMFVVMLPRASVVMLGGGMVAGYGSQVIDLTGTPPPLPEVPYEVVDMVDRLPVNAKAPHKDRAEGRIRGLVWHHTATKGWGWTQVAEYHTEARGWHEIGYHYGIDYRGVVYILNRPTTVSNHTANHNTANISVVLLGNYEERPVFPAMKSTMAKLQWDLVEKYDIEWVWTHAETKATLCPGKYAKEVIAPMLFGPRP